MTDPAPSPAGALQLRLVVTADDLDTALAFYRDTLGLPASLDLEQPDGARVVVLEAGRATLELVNPAQRAYIDEVEVGRPVAREIRVAFEVADARTTADALADAGAEVLAPPTETPWGSLNARLEAPAGLQITVFEQREPE